jgi:hypothetical protein
MCHNDVATAKGCGFPAADIPSREQRIQGQDNDEFAKEPCALWKSHAKSYYLKKPVPIMLNGKRMSYGKPKWRSTNTANHEEAVAFMKAHTRTPEQLAQASHGKGLTFRKLTRNFFAVSSPWTQRWRAKKG